VGADNGEFEGEQRTTDSSRGGPVMAARRHTGGSIRGGLVAASVGGSSVGGVSEVSAARLVCSRAARGPDVEKAGGRICVRSVEALQRCRSALRAVVESLSPKLEARGGDRAKTLGKGTHRPSEDGNAYRSSTRKPIRVATALIAFTRTARTAERCLVWEELRRLDESRLDGRSHNHDDARARSATMRQGRSSLSSDARESVGHGAGGAIPIRGASNAPRARAGAARVQDDLREGLAGGGTALRLLQGRTGEAAAQT
jgi:hypothetical protein